MVNNTVDCNFYRQIDIGSQSYTLVFKWTKKQFFQNLPFWGRYRFMPFKTPFAVWTFKTMKQICQTINLGSPRAGLTTSSSAAQQPQFLIPQFLNLGMIPACMSSPITLGAVYWLESQDTLQSSFNRVDVKFFGKNRNLFQSSPNFSYLRQFWLSYLLILSFIQHIKSKH